MANNWAMVDAITTLLRQSSVWVGCASFEAVTQVFRVRALKKLRQEPMLARVSAHRHYPFARVVTMRVGADGWRRNSRNTGAVRD
jgi:hypothetical protein